MQQNCMKFTVKIALNRGFLTLTLGLSSSFSLGIVNILLSRFGLPFKCTVDEKLQTLITPYSNALCN